MSYSPKNPAEKSFPQIILGHFEKILEISRHELRPSERILLLNDAKQVIESEDTRLSYILAIENLAYCLEPYFDKTMTDYFKEHIVFLFGFGFQIIEKLKETQFKEKLESLNGQQQTDFLIGIQVQEAKQMFRQIGSLMKRVDYLKSAIYGEVDDLELEGGGL